MWRFFLIKNFKIENNFQLNHTLIIFDAKRLESHSNYFSIWILKPMIKSWVIKDCFKVNVINPTYPRGSVGYPDLRFSVFCWPPLSSAALEKMDYGQKCPNVRKGNRTNYNHYVLIIQCYHQYLNDIEDLKLTEICFFLVLGESSRNHCW